MSLLTKTVVPFAWSTITVQFTQGAASSIDLAAFLSNPWGHPVAYAAVGVLPAGVTIAGALLQYDGLGTATSAAVLFVATDGALVATSDGTVVAIAAAPAPNQAPQFTVAPASASLPASGGTIQFTALDPEGDSVTYSLPTTRAGITINPVSGLVTVTSSAAGTSGNITVRASDGSLTRDAVCAVAVETAVGIDWNPGHYISTSGNIAWPATSDIDNISSFVNARSYLRGMLIRPSWPMIEIAFGVYDWSVVDYALGRLNSDKRLYVLLQLVEFNSSTNSPLAVIPSYLTASQYAGGCFADLKDNGRYDLNPKIWVPSVMARYIALIQAFGARYDSQTKIAGYMNAEMTFGSNLDDPAATFDGSVFIDLLTDDLFPAIRAALPHKDFHGYMNFISDGNEVPDKFERLRDVIRAQKGTINGPDTDPAVGGKKGMQYARGAQGSPAVDCRGKIGIGCGCQSRDLGTGTVAPDYSVGWTGAQYIQWMYGTQRITHGVWAYYPTAPRFQQVMAYLAANPSTSYHSAYPSEFPGA